MAALIRIFTLSLCFVMLSWTVAQGIPYRPNNLLASLQTSGMTCAGAGHRNGCCKGGIHACAVVVGGTVVCYCDEGCHAVGQCCSDIRTIGCIPTTCATAGLPAGCCRWKDGNCRTSQFQGCYCDRACHLFGDCCSDVPMRSQLNCGNSDIISQVQDERPFPFNLRRNDEFRPYSALLELMKSRMRATSQNQRSKEN